VFTEKKEAKQGLPIKMAGANLALREIQLK
jgi:hypothetical protein